MIKIGITGHRPHRLKVPAKKLAGRVRSVLSRLVKAAMATGATGPYLDIVSPLAEGCDRVVAHEALALAQQLSAVIPFERRDYETTFTDAATTRDFRVLWRASHERAVLKGLLTHAEAGYVAVGMVTLARADLVLTIWDGQPAQGRGGTPEILQSAIEWGIPVIWVHATEDRKPVLLMAATHSRRVDTLARVAKLGKPLTAAVYGELVGLVRRDGSA
jgi:hypothetical protein